MLKINEDLKGALIEYIRLLKEEEYFEAHEVLEEAWHPLRLNKDPLALVVKGFINGAISLEHIKRNKKNMESKAQKVMTSYLRYRDNCTPTMLYSRTFYEAKEYVDEQIIKHKRIFRI